MGDIETASTLTLIAAILQLIFSLILILMGVGLFLLMMPFILDPYFLGFMWPILIAFLINPIMGVIGLVLSVIWLNWRHFPSEHKTGLIVTGVIALIIVGFLPGLLALIAGAITPSQSDYRGYVPPKTAPARVVRRCPSCGAETTSDDDRFCWSCGAAL